MQPFIIRLHFKATYVRLQSQSKKNQRLAAKAISWIMLIIKYNLVFFWGKLCEIFNMDWLKGQFGSMLGREKNYLYFKLGTTTYTAEPLFGFDLAPLDCS